MGSATKVSNAVQVTAAGAAIPEAEVRTLTHDEITYLRGLGWTWTRVKQTPVYRYRARKGWL